MNSIDDACVGLCISEIRDRITMEQNHFVIMSADDSPFTDVGSSLLNCLTCMFWLLVKYKLFVVTVTLFNTLMQTQFAMFYLESGACSYHVYQQRLFMLSLVLN